MNFIAQWSKFLPTPPGPCPQLPRDHRRHPRRPHHQEALPSHLPIRHATSHLREVHVSCWAGEMGLAPSPGSYWGHVEAQATQLGEYQWSGFDCCKCGMGGASTWWEMNTFICFYKATWIWFIQLFYHPILSEIIVVNFVAPFVSD